MTSTWAAVAQNEDSLEQARRAFKQHNSDSGNLDVLERCKRLNEFLTQDFLRKPGQGPNSKVELQQILALLSSGPKRPACLDTPPITHSAGKGAPAKPCPHKHTIPTPHGVATLGDFDADRLLGALDLEDEGSQGSMRLTSASSNNSSCSPNPHPGGSSPEDVDDLIGLLNADAQPCQQRTWQGSRRSSGSGQQQISQEQERRTREQAEQRESERRQQEVEELQRQQRKQQQEEEEQQLRQQHEEEQRQQRRVQQQKEEAEQQRQAQQRLKVQEQQRGEEQLQQQRKEEERQRELQLQREKEQRQRVERQQEEERRRRVEIQRQQELKRRQEEEQQRLQQQAEERRRQEQLQQQRLAAACQLQAAVRALLARRTHARLRTLHTIRCSCAARTIQAAWRAWASLPENIWKLGPVRAAASAAHSHRCPRPISADPDTLLAQPVRLRAPGDTRSAPQQEGDSSGEGHASRHAHRTVSGVHARSSSMRREEAQQRGDVATRAVMAASRHRDTVAAIEAARRGSLKCRN
mmetsp:Transcript_6363/g.16953  ORF Transcript_6363/g.16953 Transcript_6363/m.16953 type:complete len:524 (+) Transcript_6363:44-1615(+)